MVDWVGNKTHSPARQTCIPNACGHLLVRENGLTKKGTSPRATPHSPWRGEERTHGLAPEAQPVASDEPTDRLNNELNSVRHRPPAAGSCTAVRPSQRNALQALPSPQKRTDKKRDKSRRPPPSPVPRTGRRRRETPELAPHSGASPTD